MGIEFYKIIQKALETHDERSTKYGNAYYEHGNIMKAIFPNGIVLKTEEDFARFTLFDMAVSKLHRYSKSFSEGGHKDSIHDAGVYSFMLEEVDEKINKNGKGNI